jgi:23S rRNA A1618 N6-methylase RlmF
MMDSMDVSDEEDHDNNVVREGSLEISSSSRKRQHRDSSSNNNNGDDDSSISTTTLTTSSSLDILERSQNPNFEELARHYPKFRAAWTATKSIQKERTTKGKNNNNNNASSSFSSCVTQEFTIELTKALLSSQFRLKLPYLDEDHLCPPIPNRFFYLHWIHTQLLKIEWVIGERRNTNNNNNNNNNNTPRGLDIGSGAYCIYSMLAARFFRSTMITSEIDSKSVALANANVTANHLSNMITILQVSPSHSQQQQQNNSTTSIGGPLQRSVEAYLHIQQQQQQQQQNHCSPLKLDFVMTNPPFYDPTSMEISTARVGDGRSRTNMTVSEGNYPGGEIDFVTEMIEDSLRMTTTTSDEIQSTTMATTTTTESHHHFTAGWYSSMLGKKTSMIKLQKLLVHILGPAHVEATEYGPGHYTRWFLAWTLERPPATASGALCPHSDKDHFQVDLIETREAAVGEVVNRIVTFCDTSPGGWDLTTTTTTSSTNGEFGAIIRIQETMSPTITNFVDETQSEVDIPESILRVLRGRRDNSRFLPDEGHFFVEIKIQVARNNNTFDNSAENQPMTVDVHLSCYRHSARGAKAIEKIRCLERDVQRTSRKWRRIRERQEQQEQ